MKTDKQIKTILMRRLMAIANALTKTEKRLDLVIACLLMWPNRK